MWKLALFFSFSSLFAEVSALYLSWYADPTTTICIQWHTPLDEYGNTIQLQTAEGEWNSLEGKHLALDKVLVHKVSVEHLQPNTDYTFRIGTDPTTYRFRTAPSDLTSPFRFVIGGDLYLNKKIFRKMCQTVKEHDPLFVVLGGDIAYALGIHPFRSSPLRHWLSFFAEWKEQMITSDGRVIPFLIVPGNHDITPDRYDLFFNFFSFPEKQLYRTLDFGSYLSLILLDTGHFQPIEGRQTLWLNKALSNRTSIPYRFAVYHEAAYPSFYPYHSSTPKKIRTQWVPLFEKYHLLAAFENHNHAYKKTYPLKGNQIDLSGVIYFGDGAWGTSPRKTNDLWYLEKRSKKSSVFLVELTPTEATIQAIDLLNQIIDESVIHPSN